MAKRKICLMSFAVMVCWASITVADPRQSVRPQEFAQAVGVNADVVVASFAAGKIHQVLSSDNAHWLIVTQTLKSSGDEHGNLWLVNIDAEGAMQQSIPLSGIPELRHVTNWQRIPVTITAAGGIAMLVRDEEQHVRLLEFSPAGQLVFNGKSGLDLQKIGGLLGLESGEDHWLVFGSRGVIRFARDFEIKQSWQVADAEFVVAYCRDHAAGISLVSVKESGNGFQWQVLSMRSSNLTEPAQARLAYTETRHFLVQCFMPGHSETLVVMPDLNNGSTAWDLARVSSDGKTDHDSLKIPQNSRKTHATRAVLSKDKIHFLSIENGRAWHTAFDVRNGRRLHTRALALPIVDADTLVSGLELATRSDGTIVAMNYLAAHGKKPIRAAVLISLSENAGIAP